MFLFKVHFLVTIKVFFVNLNYLLLILVIDCSFIYLLSRLVAIDGRCQLVNRPPSQPLPIFICLLEKLQLNSFLSCLHLDQNILSFFYL